MPNESVHKKGDSVPSISAPRRFTLEGESISTSPEKQVPNARHRFLPGRPPIGVAVPEASDSNDTVDIRDQFLDSLQKLGNIRAAAQVKSSATEQSTSRETIEFELQRQSEQAIELKKKKGSGSRKELHSYLHSFTQEVTTDDGELVSADQVVNSGADQIREAESAFSVSKAQIESVDCEIEQQLGSPVDLVLGDDKGDLKIQDSSIEESKDRLVAEKVVVEIFGMLNANDSHSRGTELLERLSCLSSKQRQYVGVIYYALSQQSIVTLADSRISPSVALEVKRLLEDCSEVQGHHGEDICLHRNQVAETRLENLIESLSLHDLSLDQSTLLSHPSVVVHHQSSIQDIIATFVSEDEPDMMRQYLLKEFVALNPHVFNRAQRYDLTSIVSQELAAETTLRLPSKLASEITLGALVRMDREASEAFYNDIMVDRASPITPEGRRSYLLLKKQLHEQIEIAQIGALKSVVRQECETIRFKYCGPRAVSLGDEASEVVTAIQADYQKLFDRVKQDCEYNIDSSQSQELLQEMELVIQQLKCVQFVELAEQLVGSGEGLEAQKLLCGSPPETESTFDELSKLIDQQTEGSELWLRLVKLRVKAHHIVAQSYLKDSVAGHLLSRFRSGQFSLDSKRDRVSMREQAEKIAHHYLLAGKELEAIGTKKLDKELRTAYKDLDNLRHRTCADWFSLLGNSNDRFWELKWGAAKLIFGDDSLSGQVERNLNLSSGELLPVTGQSWGEWWNSENVYPIDQATATYYLEKFKKQSPEKQKEIIDCLEQLALAAHSNLLNGESRHLWMNRLTSIRIVLARIADLRADPLLHARVNLIDARFLANWHEDSQDAAYGSLFQVEEFLSKCDRSAIEKSLVAKSAGILEDLSEEDRVSLIGEVQSLQQDLQLIDAVRSQSFQLRLTMKLRDAKIADDPKHRSTAADQVRYMRIAIEREMTQNNFEALSHLERIQSSEECSSTDCKRVKNPTEAALSQQLVSNLDRIANPPAASPVFQPN